MMATCNTTCTATPCRTAFSTRAFRTMTRIPADTAFAVSVFVLLGILCLPLVELGAVLLGIQLIAVIVAVVVVFLVRIMKQNRMHSKRDSSVHCPGA